MDNLEYFIFGAVGILCVFSLAIWLERMVKVVVANYMLTWLCLALWTVIDRFVLRIESVSPWTGATFAFLVQNKTIVILVIYLLLLLLIFLKSNIRVSMNASWMKRFFLTILFVPLTVTSIIMTLELAILGADAFNMTQMTITAQGFSENPFVFSFVQMTPVWLFLHTLITILLISQISFPKFRRRAMESDHGIE